MPNRIYQIIALAILIGAPILVNMISNALPGVQQAAEAAAQNSTEEPAVASTQDEPAPAPPPAAAPPARIASGADAVVDVTPAFDAQGIAPLAASGDTVAPRPPAPPAAPKPAVQPETVASYTPPLKTQGPPRVRSAERRE